MAVHSSAENPFGSARDVIAKSTRPNGTLVFNADDLVSPHIKGLRSFSEAHGRYRELKAFANAARDAGFAEALRQRATAPDPIVVFTAGGPGSGKSTLIHTLPLGTLVYDTILGNAAHARKWFDAVKASGRHSQVQYVYRDFAEAVRANLRRAQRENRLATAPQMARAHFDARNAIAELTASFGESGDCLIELYENCTGKGYHHLSPREVGQLPRLSIDGLCRQAHDMADAIFEGKDETWDGPPLSAEIHRAFRDVG